MKPKPGNLSNQTREQAARLCNAMANWYHHNEPSLFPWSEFTRRCKMLADDAMAFAKAVDRKGVLSTSGCWLEAEALLRTGWKAEPVSAISDELRTAAVRYCEQMRIQTHPVNVSRFFTLYNTTTEAMDIGNCLATEIRIKYRSLSWPRIWAKAAEMLRNGHEPL